MRRAGRGAGALGGETGGGGRRGGGGGGGVRFKSKFGFKRTTSGAFLRHKKGLLKPVAKMGKVDEPAYIQDTRYNEAAQGIRTAHTTTALQLQPERLRPPKKSRRDIGAEGILRF
jgi:hypothetical protein